MFCFTMTRRFWLVLLLVSMLVMQLTVTVAQDMVEKDGVKDTEDPDQDTSNAPVLASRGLTGAEEDALVQADQIRCRPPLLRFRNRCVRFCPRGWRRLGRRCVLRRGGSGGRPVVGPRALESESGTEEKAGDKPVSPTLPSTEESDDEMRKDTSD